MNAFNNSLPLWGRVVFVDWYGVLSRRKFWSSAYLPDAYRTSDFRDRVDLLFCKPEVEQWMKGHLGTESIIADHLISSQVSAHAARELRAYAVLEMRRARLNQSLLAMLKRVRSGAMVVLATDNMELFEEAVRERGSFWQTFDDAIVSSSVRALKREPERFFGKWLREHSLDFPNAVLIDDDKENCDRFERAGGSAIHFDGSEECWRTIRVLHAEMQ